MFLISRRSLTFAMYLLGVLLLTAILACGSNGEQTDEAASGASDAVFSTATTEFRYSRSEVIDGLWPPGCEDRPRPAQDSCFAPNDGFKILSVWFTHNRFDKPVSATHELAEQADEIFLTDTNGSIFGFVFSFVTIGESVGVPFLLSTELDAQSMKLHLPQIAPIDLKVQVGP